MENVQYARFRIQGKINKEGQEKFRSERFLPTWKKLIDFFEPDDPLIDFLEGDFIVRNGYEIYHLVTNTILVALGLIHPATKNIKKQEELRNRKFVRYVIECSNLSNILMSIKSKFENTEEEYFWKNLRSIIRNPDRKNQVLSKLRLEMHKIDPEYENNINKLIDLRLEAYKLGQIMWIANPDLYTKFNEIHSLFKNWQEDPFEKYQEKIDVSKVQNLFYDLLSEKNKMQKKLTFQEIITCLRKKILK